MEEMLPKTGRYRHFKGNEYEVLGTARHSETLETVVVYRALYGEGELWVRPLSSWNSPAVLPDGRMTERFTCLEDATDKEKNSTVGKENDNA